MSTPNERDKEVARACIQAWITKPVVGTYLNTIASYRAEIEAAKDKEWENKHLNEALAAGRKMQALGDRIATLTAALAKAESSLALFYLSNKPSGECIKEALAAFREAKESTSPLSSSDSPSVPAKEG